jgi:hypothetical protein
MEKIADLCHFCHGENRTIFGDKNPIPQLKPHHLRADIDSPACGQTNHWHKNDEIDRNFWEKFHVKFPCQHT